MVHILHNKYVGSYWVPCTALGNRDAKVKEAQFLTMEFTF